MTAVVNGVANNVYGIYSTKPLEQFVDLQSLEKNSVSIEKGLNICGWIPFLSSYTGTGRGMMALAQLVAGVSIAAFKAVKALNEQDATTSQRLWTEAGTGVIYAMHGFGNAVRAFFEMIPFVNLVCLAYDLAGMRLRYAVEGIEQVELPVPRDFQGQLPFKMPSFNFQLPLQFATRA